MRKLTLFLIGGMLFSATALKAQDTEEVADMDDTQEAPLSLSGSVDTYYRTTLNTSDKGPSAAPVSSFANQTGFALGMINLVASKEGEKSGFVADLVFGERGDQAVFAAVNGSGDPSNAAAVNQLYAWWKPMDQLTITIGNFNTFLGYEVISPTGNFNYSTSYAFSYGPFSHTGIKADIALSDELSFMLAAMNPTDLTDFNPANNMTLGAQLGYSNDQGGAWLNLVHGNQTFVDGADQILTQIDLTTGWDLTDELYVGLNLTWNGTSSGVDSVDANSYLAAGLYVQYALSDDLSIGVRGEYLGESNGGYGILGQYNANIYDADGSASVMDFTLSANYKVGDLTLIPEFRVDMVPTNSMGGTDYDAFTDKDGEGTSSLMSVGLAAVYAF